MHECLALTMPLGSSDVLGAGCCPLPRYSSERQNREADRGKPGSRGTKTDACLSRPGNAHLPRRTLLSLTLEKVNNEKAALSQEVCKRDPIRPSLRPKAGAFSRTRYTLLSVGLAFWPAQTTTKSVFVALKVAPTQSWRGLYVSLGELQMCQSPASRMICAASAPTPPCGSGLQASVVH